MIVGRGWFGHGQSGVNTRSQRGRAGRLRVAMGLAALAMVALLYAPQPVLPQLAGAFGLGAGQVGSAVSATTLGLALAAIPMGALGEALDRRRIMVASLAVAGFLGVVLPWVTAFSLLVVLRALQGVAIAGVGAVAMGYVADEAAGAAVNSTMGLWVAGTSVGGLAGRLVGGVVGDLAGWSGGLLAVAVLSAVATASFVLLVPAERHHCRQPLRWAPLMHGLRASLADPVLYGPFAVAALGMGSFVAVYNVISFRLTGPGFDLSPAVAALVFLAYAAGTVTSVAVGRLVDRYGRTFVLLAALATTAGGLGLTVPDSTLAVFGGLVVLTAGFFGAHATASAWVAGRLPPGRRGHGSAVYQFAYYLGASVGGVLGGLAYSAWEWSGLTLALGVAIGIIVMVCLMAAHTENRQRSAR